MFSKKWWFLGLLPCLIFFLPGCGNQSNEAIKPEKFAPPPPSDSPVGGGGGAEKAEG